MTLVMAYSLRFKLCDIGRNELVEMIKLMAGQEFKQVNISKYRFQQRFDPPDDKIQYHYYCEFCNKKILYSKSKQNFKPVELVCTECQKCSKITLQSTHYFLSIDLKYQLKLLFDNLDIKNEIFKFIDSTKISHDQSSNSAIMRDVYDCELHKKINNGENFYLTYNVSTDGAPLTKSGKRAFWPLQIMPNFLPPESRFKQVLLCGILTCIKEPTSDLADLFFSVFNEEATLLYRDGIEVTDLNGDPVTVKLCPLAYSVDSVCRPILQNRMQFNGYHGCSWCYHQGKYIKQVHGIRYPMHDTDPELRSHESHLIDLQIVSSLEKRQERGVKGNSLLLQIPNMDIVWSFSFDYLHAMLLGIEQQLWRQWTSCPDSHFKLSKSDRKIIDTRLQLMKPSKDIHRLPRSLKEKAKWKAAEVKSWMLIYSLPCMKGILHDTALKHYELLVNVLHTLLKTNITKQDMDKAEYNAIQFVGYYQAYYGIESMTFNIHTFLHVIQCIQKSGPLWSSSTFPFETNIYHLKQLVNGPNRMDQQMARKHLQKLHFKTGNVTYSTDILKDYCNSLFQYKKLSTFFEYGEENTVFIGKCYYKTTDDGFYRVYKKCLYKNKVFHSIKYKKARRTTDTVVQLKSGRYGQILDIIEKDKNCYLILSDIKVCLEDPFNVEHIKEVDLEDFDNFQLVPITEIDSKNILLTVNDKKYLCKLPNNFESQ